MRAFLYLLLTACACATLAACAVSTPTPAPGGVPTAPVPTTAPVAVTPPQATLPPAAPLPVAPPTLPTVMGDITARLIVAEGRISSLQSQVATLQQKWMIAQQHMADTAAAFSMLDSEGGGAVRAAAALPIGATLPPAMKPAVPAKPTGAARALVPKKPAVKPVVKTPKKPVWNKPASAPVSAPVPVSAASAPSSDAALTEDAAAATPAAPAPAVGALPSATSLPTLTDVRVGNYPGKTRLVIETNRAVPYTADLDNAEKILMIQTEASAVTAKTQGAFDKSPLVAAYGIQSGTDGKAHVVVQLRTGVKIEKSQVLPAAQGKGNRILFDLVPAPAGH